MKIWMLLVSVVVLVVVAGCADDVRPVADVVSDTPAEAPAVPEPPPRAVAAAVSPGAAVLADGDGVEGLLPLAVESSLVTPSATVTVTAAGVWDLGPPDRDRVALAWLVQVSAPPPLAPSAGDPLFGDGDDLPPRDASTTLWLDTGSERLPVTAPGGDDPTVARCDEVPCRGPEPQTYVLVAGVDAHARPVLVATADGVDQRLDPGSGEVTSEVSRIGSERAGAVPVAAPAWPQRSLPVRSEAQLEDEFGSGAGDLTRGGLEVGYGGRVAEAFLAPFDRVQGWAPPGHAWLVVRVEDTFRQPALSAWRAELDAGASWTLAHDAGVATLAHPPSPSDVLAFLIPDDVRSVTLAYQPAGTVGLPPDAHHEFRAPEPLTAEIALP
ncbi:hypothetical protein E1212_21960 [Jiangella ureilytica]|uniref:Uncharacterized protein n=1 Tax=Jiangella ureilytica TaxID=2530374 RepID=A0A4R4RFN1_9ACTN|nr:hypothetical protein [Jiangella ureilytica]TDC48188.1 hypothetical protein E1212_21960 [Jiangella ureilytica]